MMMMLQRAPPPPPSIMPFWEVALETLQEGRQANKLGEREREEKLRNKYSSNFTQIERSKNYGSMVL